MLVAAAVLAALGSVDSLLTSLVADNVTRSYHDSDKELVGQGIGNVVAGMFGGIGGAGATIRTLSSVQAGGRTPLSGVVRALTLLAIVLPLVVLVLTVFVDVITAVAVGILLASLAFVKQMAEPQVDSIKTMLLEARATLPS